MMKLPKSSAMLLLASGQFVFDIFSAGLSSPAGMISSGTARYNIIQYSTALYSTLRYSTVQYIDTYIHKYFELLFISLYFIIYLLQMSSPPHILYSMSSTPFVFISFFHSIYIHFIVCYICRFSSSI